jgi:hypothetical protein
MDDPSVLLLIKSVIEKMEVWCNYPETGIHITSQPSLDDVREWRKELQQIILEPVEYDSDGIYKPHGENS